MASVNKVILMGNLGRDPEVRYSPDGAAVCNVSIATTSSWKDKTSGERREETEWHRVVFYNRLAEIAGEYLKKGRPVYVEGRIKTRKWQNKEGVDQYTTEVVADNMQLLGGRDGGDGGSSGGNEGGSGAPRPAARGPQAARPAAPAAGGGVASLFAFGGLAQAGRLVQSKFNSCARADLLLCLPNKKTHRRHHGFRNSRPQGYCVRFEQGLGLGLCATVGTRRCRLSHVGTRARRA